MICHSESFEAELRQFAGYVDIFQVDTYQIHNLVTWARHLPILERLSAQRKIGIIGATHHSHASFGELLRVMSTERVQQSQAPTTR